MTVGKFKTEVNWPQVLNLEASDPRWISYLNQALERFSHMALWDRYVQPYRVCVDRKACITWPRQFLTIEAIDVCSRPFTLRNQWFEYLENGPGRATVRGCSANNVHDRGRGFVMFDDLAVASVLRLYPRFTSDIGKSVLVRGYDSNGQWMLTNGGNTVGEVLTLQTPYVDSTTVWMPQVFREVIKDATKGPVTAWGYDASLPVPPAAPGPTDTPLQALAVWEADETVPDYRRSFIPSLANTRRACQAGEEPGTSDCTRAAITVLAKLQHVPVSGDLDILPISSLAALKNGMLAIMLEERHDYAGAQVAMYGTFDPVKRRYMGGAVPALEEELDDFQGAGTVVPLRLEPDDIGRAGVVNII